MKQEAGEFLLEVTPVAKELCAHTREGSRVQLPSAAGFETSRD